MIEAADLHQYREGRVVEHEAAVGILGALVVTPGPERSHDLHAVERQDIVVHPLPDGVVDRLRRQAVVGGALWLELLDEAVVVVLYFLGRSPFLCLRLAHSGVIVVLSVIDAKLALSPITRKDTGAYKAG